MVLKFFVRQDEPFHLSSPQNYWLFHTNGKHSSGAFHIFNQNFQNFGNSIKENSRNSRSKIEWKENFGVKFFRKFGYTLQGLSSFLEILKKYCSIQVDKNSNQTFWLNGSALGLSFAFN